MIGEMCPGSKTWPTSYDGATTLCEDCGRRLLLDVGGLLPNHGKVPKRPTSMLPRGEAIYDGRRLES